MSDSERETVETPQNDFDLFLRRAMELGWTVELRPSENGGYNFAVGGITLFEHDFGDWERFTLGRWHGDLTEAGWVAAVSVARGDERTHE